MRYKLARFRWAQAAALALALVVSRGYASDLSYTFVDFGALAVKSDATGRQSPTAGQTVAVEAQDGDGLEVAGSLALGRRFYLAASYDSAVVDVDAVVTSPLASAETSGNFDLLLTRVGFGYVQPIGQRLDLQFELGRDKAEYDFGSFAGENFDVKDSALAAQVGLRFHATDALELFLAARGSDVGEVDLTQRRFVSGTEVSAGLRYYFFEDLGLGIDFRSGDVDSFALSLRFGFGELRAGGRR
jgi:opacity protein-like surface antigen